MMLVLHHHKGLQRRSAAFERKVQQLQKAGRIHLILIDPLPPVTAPGRMIERTFILNPKSTSLSAR
jgi:hypothetical protein